MRSFSTTAWALGLGILLIGGTTGCGSSAPPAATSATPAKPATNGEAAPGGDAIRMINAPPVAMRPESGSAGDAAPAPSLGIGDKAPPLAIAEWVTGAPLDGLETGTISVVEFWATWCGPCRTSMPHISELQDGYGDTVRFVGVTRETTDVVKDFLAKEQSPGKTWTDVITYRLAVDQDDTTNDAYMKAANQTGIPTAFIVGKEGMIEWIGHPMTIDKPLEQIVAGTWDRQAAIAEFATRQRLRAAQRKISLLQRAGAFDEALAALADLEKEMGDVPGLLAMRMQLLTAAKRLDEVAALRGTLVDKAWDDSAQLNELAWQIAIGPAKTGADLEVALKASRRAAELTAEKDAAVLDTLARVLYEQGNLAEAIAWQRKAVEQAPDMKDLGETLEKYLAEQAGPAPPPADSTPAETAPAAETPSNP